MRTHLAPLTRSEQRVWEVGGLRPKTRPRELRLASRPGDYRSFASLEAILTQLSRLTSAKHAPALKRLWQYIRESSPSEPEGYGRLLGDAVAYAVLRRISRESVYTAQLIDHGARTLNQILGDLAVERVVVPEADRLDRPTLKLLARGVLLAPPSCPFAWVWNLGSVPRHAPGESLQKQSRARLFQQLSAMLNPLIVPGTERPTPSPAPMTAGNDPAYELSAALVLQNYDACFAWGEKLIADGEGGDDPAAVEVLRLMALAAVNLGATDIALELLSRAELGCEERPRLAHLAYLKGLISAKRSYDLDNSDGHYRRGLAFLEDRAADDDDDLRLERAWLFNGLALNRAIEWRRESGCTATYEEAFRLVKSAFDLVRESRSRAAGYLRFNLVANLAFLLEMNGRYDLAIEALARAFDFGPGSPTELPSGHTALSYRLGVLCHRLGDRDRALAHLREAEAVDGSAENWPTRERILRAIGAVCLATGTPEEAEAAYREGLLLSRENRSADGTAEHGSGLVAALVRQGHTTEVEETIEALGEEAISIGPPEQIEPRQPNPKLPAYFPEVDLEEVPEVDLNRYLAAPALGGGGRPS